MNFNVAKILASLAIFAISEFCWAGDLRTLVESVQAKETKLSDSGIRMWTVEQINPYSPAFGQTFVWVRMDGAAQWKVRDVQKNAVAIEVLKSPLANNSEVTIQGGFFGENFEGKYYPLGLIISDGKKINEKKSWSSGGALYIRNGVTGIAKVSELDKNFSAQQAIQSKPLVVENGHNGIHTPDSGRFNRVAVGISKTGNIVVAGAFSPDQGGATLFDFAEALIAFGTRNKDELVTAIAMDGGPGAHIYVHSGHRLFGYAGTAFVPNVIDFSHIKKN